MGADSELSVKNGAELLDRLVKDIVSESAATYVSVLATPDFGSGDKDFDQDNIDLPTAFSLKRFMPLLKDRIFVLNPFTRTFLVGWIVLLDSIPDLELVAYLPEFLSGLLTFLSDTNRDVHIATQNCLDKFLSEIRRIARIKKGIADSRKSKTRDDAKRKRARAGSLGSAPGHDAAPARGLRDGSDSSTIAANAHASADRNGGAGSDDSDGGVGADDDNAYDEEEEDDGNNNDDDDDDGDSEDDWVPGQDVHIHYAAILDILTDTLDSPQGMLDSLAVQKKFPLSSLRDLVVLTDPLPIK